MKLHYDPITCTLNLALLLKLHQKVFNARRKAMFKERLFYSENYHRYKIVLFKCRVQKTVKGNLKTDFKTVSSIKQSNIRKVVSNSIAVLPEISLEILFRWIY